MPAALLLVLPGLAFAQTTKVTPTALAYNLVAGNSLSQNLTLTGALGTAYNIGATPASGGTGWLSVSPASGTLPAAGVTVSVRVDASTLPAGKFSGNVTIFAGGVFLSVPVSVTVTPNLLPLTVDPDPVSISIPSASTSTITKQVTIFNSSQTAVSFLISAASTFSGNCPGGNPLTVGQTSATLNPFAQLRLTLSVNATGFTSGSCTGRFTLSPVGAPAYDVLVSLNVVTNQLQSDLAALSFAYQTGGNPPPLQTFSVKPITGNQVPVTLSAGSPPNNWLQLGSTNANTGDTGLIAAISSTALAALPSGTYQGAITVSSTVAGAVPNVLTIPVTLTVSANPQLTVAPAIVPAFNYTTGGTLPAAFALQVSTTGPALPFSAASQTQVGNWLQVVPPSGSASQAFPGAVTLVVNPAGLCAGTYSGLITLSAAGSANVVVPVTLNVTTPVPMSISPSRITFNYQPGQAAPPAQTIAFTPNAALTYAVDPSPVAWLQLAASSTGVTLSVKTTGLTAGLYSTNVIVRAAGASNSPVTVPVLMNVSTTPSFNVAPQELIFQSQGYPQTKTLQLTSTSAAASVHFTVNTFGAPWLSATPLEADSPSSIVVRADPAFASSTTQTQTLRITQIVNGVAGATFDIPVTLNKSSSGITLSSNSSGVFPASGGSGTFTIFSTNACGWTASSGASWLAVAPLSGTSNATASYSVAPNTGLARLASVTVMDNTYTVLQASANPALSPPAVVSVTPNTGAGASQSFTAAFTDPNGWAYIAHARLLLSTSFAPSGGCYVDYAPGRGFSLMNDAGTQWLGPVPDASPAVLSNSLCTLSAANSFASGADVALTVNFALTFNSSFIGKRGIFLVAYDADNLASPALALGSWYPVPTAPSLIKRYRLYDPTTRSHHYTTDCNEYVTLGGFGFMQEGSDSAIYDGPGDSTLIPFWRIYFAQFGTHFWTTDSNEYRTLVTGYPGYYVGEGSDGFLLSALSPVVTTALPLNRLLYLGPGAPVHHWSTDPNEVNTLIANGDWISEGVPGYVFPQDQGAALGCPAVSTSNPGKRGSGFIVAGEKFAVSGAATRILIDGEPVAATRMPEGRLEAIAPAALEGRESVNISVERDQAPTRTITAKVAPADPAILSNTGPAQPGAPLTLSVSGLGQGCPNPVVRLAGFPAELLNRQPGTLQVRVPLHLPADAATPVTLHCGEWLSQAGVTVAVR